MKQNTKKADLNSPANNNDNKRSARRAIIIIIPLLFVLLSVVVVSRVEFQATRESLRARWTRQTFQQLQGDPTSSKATMKRQQAADDDKDRKFPFIISVKTTPEVLATHGSGWDILRGESYKENITVNSTLSKRDGTAATLSLLHLSIIVNSPSELAQFESLSSVTSMTDTKKNHKLLLDDRYLAFQPNDQLTNVHIPIQFRHERNLQQQQQQQQQSSKLNPLFNAEDAWITQFSQCYRTVDETYASLQEWAAQYPDWVTIDTVGPSYLRTIDPTGQDGHDIPVAIINVPSAYTNKAPMMIVAGHHSRELTPPETVMTFMEYLMTNYGKDADITWILDHTEFHIVPIANPDGRVIVQNHLDWLYRKNARPFVCSSGEQFDGVDLNRNYPMNYGYDDGSSSDPCHSAYRGTGPISEPESQAIYEYAGRLFPSAIQKGTVAQASQRLEEPCDENAVGIFLDVHSAGNFVYYPWGYKNDFPPNKDAILAMGSKLAYPGNYQLWGPGSPGFLYPASGDCSDTMYGQYCVPSYGYELGSTFYETCEDWEKFVVPVAFQSFLYAAKTATAAYKLPQGPDVLNITSELFQNNGTWGATAFVSDEMMNQFQSQPVVGVKVYVDVFPTDQGAVGLDMNAVDGAFDEATEYASIDIDTRLSGWAPGRHIVYFQAMDADGFVGPVSAVFVDVESYEEEEEVDAATDINEVANTHGDAEGGTSEGTADPGLGVDSDGSVANGDGEDTSNAKSNRNVFAATMFAMLGLGRGVSGEMFRADNGGLNI